MDLKYRSEQHKNSKTLIYNNIDYLIDRTFRNINRSFVLSFKNADNDPTRNSFDKYYMPSVEMKEYNALIDSKLFFDQPGKNKQEAYGKLIEISRNDDFTTGNLLSYLYHQSGMDVSRQTNKSIT